MKQGYDHQKIEKKWRSRWKDEKLYHVDLQNAQKPFYNLWMFPYPSGARMHVGHAYASTGSDIVGRYKRMQGYNVFQPMGFDAFGIHGENYAIKIGKHPAQLMEDLSDRFRDEQFDAIGHGYDWEREVRTYWPSYYKWTQWIFVQLFKHGLAERKVAKVNWCSSCKTVLADEQVITGECERCHSNVEKKEMEQWFLKITKYADQLLDNLDHIDWSKKIVEAQRQWIGRKEGIEISYSVDGTKETITCFTTRPDTNFGATFVVLAPEHELVRKIIDGEYSNDDVSKQEMKQYVKKAMSKSDIDRVAEGRQKTGVFTGLYAVNQLNNRKMPVWISDFVLGEYGTGAVVGVPGHDKRDFEFAKEFDLPVIRVVVASDGDTSEITRIEQVQEDEGVMVNSGFLDGEAIQKAIPKMMDFMEKKGWGKRKVSFRLRDWLISRQRYWSAPIPIIYCGKCGVVPVPEKDLPVELPYVKDWQPKGDGRGPLASIPEFVNTICPKCGGEAERETDTLDNFLDSGWYFFRYPFANREDVPFAGTGVEGADDGKPDSSAFKKWFPVHLYIGGPEHAVLHLMYTRFLTMAFKDMGFIDFDEPFVKFFAHGHITKDGKKMSKSLGNIVIPDEYLEKVGADAFRIYLMFLGPFDRGGDFNDSGLSGVTRFLQRVWDLVHDEKKADVSKSSAGMHKLLSKTIMEVERDIKKFKFNTPIAKLMEFVNAWGANGASLSKKDTIAFIKLLAPFAPFVSEEMYQSLSKVSDKFTSIHVQSWPEYDAGLIEDELVSIAIQVNGKVRGVLEAVSKDVSQSEVEEQAKKIVQKYIKDKVIKKTIYIPAKIVNFVV